MNCFLNKSHSMIKKRFNSLCPFCHNTLINNIINIPSCQFCSKIYGCETIEFYYVANYLQLIAVYFLPKHTLYSAHVHFVTKNISYIISNEINLPIIHEIPIQNFNSFQDLLDIININYIFK